MALLAPSSSVPAVSARRLSPEHARFAIEGGAVLLDIRSQAARSNQGVLPGALAVDQFELLARCAPGGAESLRRAADPDTWWILVSANGLSSLPAARRLRAAGLGRVSDVVGGFAALRAAKQAFAASNAPHASRECSTVAAHF